MFSMFSYGFFEQRLFFLRKKTPKLEHREASEGREHGDGHLIFLGDFLTGRFSTELRKVYLL